MFNGYYFFAVLPFSFCIFNNGVTAAASHSRRTTNAGRSLSVTGTDDFYALVRKADKFVDKTRFIMDYLRGPGQVIRIARPRRFGKTINVNMLKRFLMIETNETTSEQGENRANRHLFTGGLNLTLETRKGGGHSTPLKISEYAQIMKLQGQFPVISISFKEVEGWNYDQIETGMRKAIAKLFKEHSYLIGKLNSQDAIEFAQYQSGKFSTAKLERSLLFLSTLLKNRFKRNVHILIDDYDRPLMQLWISLLRRHTNGEYRAPESTVLKTVLQSDESDAVISLIRSILSSGLKGNYALAKSLIIGTIKIRLTDALLGGLNNVLDYDLTENRFSDYFGFGQRNVDNLLSRVAPTNNELDRVKMKDWFRGAFRTVGKILYNPWSVVNFLSNNARFEEYWKIGLNTPFVEELILSDEVQEILPELVDGGNVTRGVSVTVPYDLMSYMLHHLLVYSGYFSAIPVGTEAWELYAPNEELKHLYRSAIVKWIGRRMNTSTDEFIAMTNHLANFDMEQFSTKLRRLLPSIPDFVEESKMQIYYHAIVRTLLYCFSDDYVKQLKFENSYSRPDVILTSKPQIGNRAIVIRYKISEQFNKLDRKVKKCLNEITGKDYQADFFGGLGHLKEILKICMIFHARKRYVEYTVENIR